MPAPSPYHPALPLLACSLLLGCAIPAAVDDAALRCTLPSAPSGTHATASCQTPMTGTALDIDAEAGQLLLWTMDGGTHAYKVDLHGPDGAWLRHWPAVHNGQQDIGWVTPAAGRYRLQAANPYFPAAPADSTVQWALRAHGPARLEDSPAPDTAASQRSLASPRLRQLQERLAQATPAQKAHWIEEFWQQVSTQGAPLLEPIPQQPQEALATFVWRAPASAAEVQHQVRLEWAVRSADSFALQPLPDTDIWFLSLPLPRGLRASYQLVVHPMRYPAAQGQPVSRMQRVQTQQLFAQRDALNPHIWHAGSPQLDPDSAAARHAQRSALHIAPDGPLRNLAAAPILPQLTGTLQHLRFASQQLHNTRSLSLYLPPGTHPPGSLPLLVLFDREAYLERAQLPQRLEQAIQQGRIPPMAAVLIANPTREDRARELPPHTPAFGRMLATELLPWLRARAPVLGRHADQVVVAGSSYGGLAAGYLGWTHPETFGHVLSLSGSYWWSPGHLAHRWSEGDWFMQQVARSPARPVRWRLSYGLLERGVQGESGIVDNNRHLRNVLQAKGYAVSTDEFAGGHDYYVWGDAIVQGLQALLPPHGP